MAPSNLPPETRAGRERRGTLKTSAARPARNAGLPPREAAGTIPPERLRALAQDLDIPLDQLQLRRLLDYAALLARWNRVHNLTAIDRGEDLLTHHLLDCLSIVRPLERALRDYAVAPPPGRELRVLDAGTGAGLPGIPLAVLHTDWRVSLVDAVQKKCAFLHQAQVELALRNVSVHHARLESCGLAAQDLIVSRAFASLADFVAATRALLAPRGLWAAMKGRFPEREIEALPPDIEALATVTLRVPQLAEERHLVLLRQAPGARPPAGPASRAGA
jgi:16S rRNA (guanine527-N7)-methyltransferase